MFCVFNTIAAKTSHLEEESFNPLTPNDPFRGRTAPLTSKRCILYIYSTNIGTEYYKRGIHSPFFPLRNAVCFIFLTYFVSVLFTFCIQDVLKLKIIPTPKVYEAKISSNYFDPTGDRGRVAQWLRCSATNRKFAGSIPAGVSRIFH